MTSDGAGRNWVELVATVLLAVATVATAWSGYQSTRWNGEQAKAGARANALRIESAKAAGLANTQTEIDVATFTQWVNAYAQEQTELADFYFKRFRREFRPAVGAWIATRPLKNPQAPLTPFAMPQYELAARAEADELEAEAELYAAQARRNIQRASNYVLGVVLFASALFFAGMSTKLTSPRLRIVMLVHRLRRLPRHGRLDRNLARQPLRLTTRRPSAPQNLPVTSRSARRAARELTRSCHLRPRRTAPTVARGHAGMRLLRVLSPKPGKGWVRFAGTTPKDRRAVCRGLLPAVRRRRARPQTRRRRRVRLLLATAVCVKRRRVLVSLVASGRRTQTSTG